LKGIVDRNGAPKFFFINMGLLLRLSAGLGKALKLPQIASNYVPGGDDASVPRAVDPCPYRERNPGFRRLNIF
jgi:hypothetical protein